ncbi:TIGR02646 family protein [Thiothrix subterranea]|uniref:hypothetical protein n=1 Tax=Thiothrix subterranea TaxID=2735563 RepID=UPI00192BB24D|nr:hypothetical protein [Thiothrix subterranea]QQZ28730.1 TIGR02646 family protein [Thiothrix subterranea]
MRAIQKQQEPDELTQYRLQPCAMYDGDASFTPVKAKIREHLLGEQGHLCADCMQRIRVDTMKIEHWQCQDNHPNAQLDYKNMLGVCTGNEGQPPKNQTCDTRKGNADLKYHPANPTHRIDSQIKYLGNGKVLADDPEFDQQLNTVLNLNYSRLVQNRKRIVDDVIRLLGKKDGSRTPAQIQKILEHWLVPNRDNQLQPYSGVAVYFLTKRLKQASRNN